MDLKPDQPRPDSDVPSDGNVPSGGEPEHAAVKASQVQITDSLALKCELYFIERGQSLDRPRELWDAKVQGLVLRREPTGKKKWHFSYPFKGRRGRVKVGNFPALGTEGARKVAMKLWVQVSGGIDVAEEKRKAKREARAAINATKQRAKRILGTFVEGPYKAWAEAHLTSHSATLRTLKADFGDTKEGEQPKGAKWKKGAGWWTRDMETLTKEEVDAWRTAELKRGLKATTINRAWQRLRAVLGKAEEWNVIGTPLRMKKLKTDKRGRVRYLSDDERQRLFAALEQREEARRTARANFNAWRLQRHKSTLPSLDGVEYTDHLQPLTRIYLGTGMRKTELLSMVKRNVDLDNGFVTIPGDVTKNRQTRTVPMTADVKATLVIWFRLRGEMEDDDFVFTYRGERLREFKKSWRRLMKLAKITNFRVHDNRHDYASRLAMKGVPLKTIALLLGHEDLTMVDRYAHLSPQHVKESVSKLDTPDDIAKLVAVTSATQATAQVGDVLGGLELDQMPRARVS